MNQLKKYWDSKRAINETQANNGLCVIDITRTGKNHARIKVVCPYREEFVTGARELQGTWRPRTKTWTFDGRAYRLLVKLCTRVYGKDRLKLAGWQGLLDERDK